MLTRRVFIIAGGSTVAAAAMASGALAGLADIPGLRTVYSHALAPQAVPAGDIVLSQDFTASLARFESLITRPGPAPVRFILDAADSVVLDIAKSRVPAAQQAAIRPAV